MSRLTQTLDTIKLNINLKSDGMFVNTIETITPDKITGKMRFASVPLLELESPYILTNSHFQISKGTFIFDKIDKRTIVSIYGIILKYFREYYRLNLILILGCLPFFMKNVVKDSNQNLRCVINNLFQMWWGMRY